MRTNYELPSNISTMYISDLERVCEREGEFTRALPGLADKGVALEGVAARSSLPGLRRVLNSN